MSFFKYNYSVRVFGIVSYLEKKNSLNLGFDNKKKFELPLKTVQLETVFIDIRSERLGFVNSKNKKFHNLYIFISRI